MSTTTATTTTTTTTTLQDEIRDIGRRAKQAALELASGTTISGQQRQRALFKMKEKLASVRDQVMTANASDVRQAQTNGLLDGPMIKRLTITDKVFDTMLSRLEEVAALDDPIGKVLEGSHTRPTGLVVQKISVPLGVIALIYESRPNVTTDAACVCLKSGNAVILRGGSESLATNQVLAKAMQEALTECGLPTDAVQLIPHKGHESVNELLQLEEYVNVIIPRGGKNLIQRISQGTNIPVIKHYEGICHQYIASDASPEWAKEVVINSKCQSIEVCNALETLLVDETHLILPENNSNDTTNSRKRTADGSPVPAATTTTTTNTSSESSPSSSSSSSSNILLDVLQALTEKGVEIRGCPKIQEFIQNYYKNNNNNNDETSGDNDDNKSQIQIVPATEDDWSTEYLAPILSIKIVHGIQEAIQHINQYGSGHTDGIVTNDLQLAHQFVQGVDSASVLVNASTRLSGGGDYGMGAVVGISTDKLHARGPVGPSELTSYKWVAYGQGHLRK